MGGGGGGGGVGGASDNDNGADNDPDAEAEAEAEMERARTAVVEADAALHQASGLIDGGDDGEEEEEEESDDLASQSLASHDNDEEDDDDDDFDEEGDVWVGVLAESGDEDLSGEEDLSDDDDAFDDYESPSDSELADFDEDAMHFEIEGEIPVGGLVGGAGGGGGGNGGGNGGGEGGRGTDGGYPVDPEEQGVYMIADGAIPTSTGMNHHQGCDSVQAASPGRLLVTGVHDVRMLDASETPTRGAFMGSTERLPFQVYSVTYEPDAKLVAVCGAVGLGDDVNLAVFRVMDIPPRAADEVTSKSSPGRTGTVMGSGGEEDGGDADDGGAGAGSGQPETEPEPSVMFIPVAEKGVGRMSRYGRQMLNCVRFGKKVVVPGLGDGGTESAGPPMKNVLLVASQDRRCYVLSIEVKGDAGGLGCWGDEEDGERSASGSDGGQGGRGARRRPRLDARLVEEDKLDFPMAVNAACAAPNGLCAAVCGDADYILVNGGPRGYGASSGGQAEYLPIDGDPETLNYITGEPQGGMYVAWSSDSEYLAATSDSLHAVAVWRVTVEREPRVSAGGGASGSGKGSGGGGSRSVPSSPARPGDAAAAAAGGGASGSGSGSGSAGVGVGGAAGRVRRRGGAGRRFRSFGSAGDLSAVPAGSSGGAGGLGGHRAGGPLRIQRVAYLRDHAHPCFPVQFLPSDSNIMVWAERGGRVHAYDLRCARAAAPGASSAVNLSPPHQHIPGNNNNNGGGGGGNSSSRRMVPPIAAAANEAAAEEATLVSSFTRRAARAHYDPNDDEDSSIDNLEEEEEEDDDDDDEEGEGVDVSLYPLSDPALEAVDGTNNNQRKFVQTIRSRVKGLYVTGMCAVPAPPPSCRPGVSCSSPGGGGGGGGILGERGFEALRQRAPPHDLVFVGTPSGVLRFRCPVAWTPASHQDFPPEFRAAARAFLLCAAADANRHSSLRREEVEETVTETETEVKVGLSLGDMPQEVLLHVVGLAAVPLSDWIGVPLLVAEEEGEPTMKEEQTALVVGGLGMTTTRTPRVSQGGIAQDLVDAGVE